MLSTRIYPRSIETNGLQYHKASQQVWHSKVNSPWDAPSLCLYAWHSHSTYSPIVQPCEAATTDVSYTNQWCVLSKWQLSLIPFVWNITWNLHLIARREPVAAAILISPSYRVTFTQFQSCLFILWSIHSVLDQMYRSIATFYWYINPLLLRISALLNSLCPRYICDFQCLYLMFRKLSYAFMDRESPHKFLWATSASSSDTSIPTHLKPCRALTVRFLVLSFWYVFSTYTQVHMYFNFHWNPLQNSSSLIPPKKYPFSRNAYIYR